jgi:hypothetical protein
MKNILTKGLSKKGRALLFRREFKCHPILTQDDLAIKNIVDACQVHPPGDEAFHRGNHMNQHQLFDEKFGDVV